MKRFKRDFSEKETYSGTKPRQDEMIVPIVLTPSLAQLLYEKGMSFYCEPLSIGRHTIPVAFEVTQKDREDSYVSTFNMKVKSYITHSEENEGLTDRESKRCPVPAKDGGTIPCPKNNNCENYPFPEVKAFFNSHYVSNRTISIDDPVTNEDGEQATRDIEDKSADGNEIQKALRTEEAIIQAIKDSKRKDFSIIYVLKKYGYKPNMMTEHLRCSSASAYRKVDEFDRFLMDVIKEINE